MTIENHFTFRPATKKELPRIVELKVAMFRDVGASNLLSEDAFNIIVEDYRKRYDRDEAIHFVAVCDSTIIAMAGAFLKSDLPYRYFQTPFYGFIGDVYTESTYRRQGLAHRLSEMAVDWLKSREVAMIKLLTSAEGRSLYEKLGFKSSNEMVLLCE